MTCDMWKAALPPSPAAWDDGVDGGLLCHLLFGVVVSADHGRVMVRFRCGPAGFASTYSPCVCSLVARARVDRVEGGTSCVTETKFGQQAR